VQAPLSVSYSDYPGHQWRLYVPSVKKKVTAKPEGTFEQPKQQMQTGKMAEQFDRYVMHTHTHTQVQKSSICFLEEDDHVSKGGTE
jgi:hypothetical protein